MAVANLPFDLLDVKLAPPLTRPGTVAKADLIGRLCAAGLPFATVIVAPAGYGKTTLLTRWAEADPRPFAWVALDSRDDDALVLLRYIAAAIHRVAPIPPEVFDALSGPGGLAWSTRVPRVGTALAATSTPMVLVLDDLHSVTNPACLDALAALFEYVPAGSQIAIASRTQPELPLARWRTQGWVHEVGVSDLRLDQQEASRMLAATGLELDAGDLAVLAEQTEGWPAGLYLAALAMQAGATTGGGAGFGGDDRFVSEYFRFELLNRLPPTEARFLTHTSVLDRMSGGLCDVVLRTTGSTGVLETLERTNCFVVPLDRRGHWYRYHHLFGRLLREELERSEPGMAPELNRRAMAWCLANDLPEAAIPYAHAAGEMEILAGLVDGLALPTTYDGRMETLDEWLGWFSDDELRRFPALAVVGAWVRVLTGRTGEAERWLALADNATSAIPLSDGSATIEPWVASLRAHMMPDGVAQALADADLALDLLPPHSAWRPDAMFAHAAAQVFLGERGLARRELLTAVEHGIAVGAVDIVIVAQAQLALLAAADGAWDQSKQHAQTAQQLVDEKGLGDYAPSALAHATTVRIAIHEGRYEDARHALTRVHRLRPLLDCGLPWLSLQVGLELTRAHLALGEAAAARTVLREVERILELRPDMGVLIADAQLLRDRVAATRGSAGAWAMSLTNAEIRLLPYLATHLTFPEIADRLFISRNTVKTEAVSIYRKLGASSRSEAIERAVEVGFLEASVPPRANLIPDG